MPSAHIVVHYHELWLKRGNRAFFLHQLRDALRRALDGIAISRISQPADRLIIESRTTTGLIVLRALAPEPGLMPMARRALANAQCRIGPVQ